MKATYRCSRKGSARHNDRDFDLDLADHIQQDKTSLNINWHCAQRINPNMTFKEAEEFFYEKRYSKALEATNKRYKAQYHPERCKTIQDVLNGPKTRPDEVIMQIGNLKENPGPKVLVSCLKDYMKRLNDWNRETGYHLRVLNYSVHLDEKTPHFHQRQCWEYIDADGNPHLGQERALKEAGIELPYPDKPVSRFNNRKMTFDAMNRQMWQDVLKEHGLVIDTVPSSPRAHLEKEEYIDEQIAKKEEELKRLESQIKWTKNLRDKQQELWDR